MSMAPGRERIEEILPHRDPFLFLDEVVVLEPGARVVARKRVREVGRSGEIVADTAEANQESPGSLRPELRA